MNLVDFAVSGTLLTILIWFMERRAWKMWVRILCSFVALSTLAVFVYFQTGPPTLGERDKWFETSPYIEIVFFILMIAGMVARYITKAIEIRREKIADLMKRGGNFDKPRLEIDVWEFSYPLFFSVVTYGALLSQLKDSSFSLANATLSFQTGFFWQTLLVTKQRVE